MKLPLTICILTHRFEARFQRALKSAQCAAEVLVVDTSGSDTSAHLPSEHAYRSVTYPELLRHFGEARTWALAQARFDWVLFLDSDEVLETSANELAHLLEQQRSAYTVTRSDVFHSTQLKYGEAGNQRIVRLVRRSQARFTGRVHEVAQVDGKIGKSSIHILHYSHTSVREFLEDIFWYSKLAGNSTPTPTWKLMLELIAFPPGKFLYTYLLKLGFLDGWAGLCYASCMSLHSACVRIYRYESQN